MSLKLEKLTAEIKKTKARITVLQARLQEMEQQQSELENTEIVELVRSVTATPEELAAFIKAFRAQSGAPFTFTKQEEPENE